MTLIKTPFHLTNNEILESTAISLILNKLLENQIACFDVKDICDNPQYGFTASAVKEPIGVKYLRITDIKNGLVLWDNVPYCKCENIDNYKLETGDILIARSGSVGKSFIVSDIKESAVFASYLIRVKVKNNVQIESKYLYWCFQSQQFWQQIMAFCRGSAMKNINAKMIIQLSFPFPSLSVQQKIVNFLDTLNKRLQGFYLDLPDLPPPLGGVVTISEAKV